MEVYRHIESNEFELLQVKFALQLHDAECQLPRQVRSNGTAIVGRMILQYH